LPERCTGEPNVPHDLTRVPAAVNVTRICKRIMSATPRIVFSTFRSSNDPMFLAWARFLRSVESAARQSERATVVERPAAEAAARLAAGPAAIGACGIWRILASNNRELGRSARAYTSFESARSHVLRLRAGLDDLTVSAVTGGRPGMHGWYMSVRASAVITCGRWYGAAASSAEASLATIDALRDAVVSDVSRELTPPRRGEHAPETDAVW
jgi:hypothetical protein